MNVEYAKKKVLSDQLFEVIGGMENKAHECFVRETTFPLAKQDPNFKFTREQLKTFMILMSGYVGRNLFIGGPAGSGKSSSTEQFFSRLGVHVYPVQCHGQMDPESLIGQWELVLDSGVQVTKWMDGPLIRAYREGAVLMLDEYDYSSHNFVGSLNLALDGRPILIRATGELVEPHKDFRIVATANTFGGGDEKGVYKNTKALNVANMDRFIFMEVSYLEALQESQVLNNHLAGMPGPLLQKLLVLAGMVRAAFIGDGEESASITLSTRGLMRTGRCVLALQCYNPQSGVVTNMDAFHRALDMGFLKQANARDRQLIMAYVETIGFA